MIQTEQILATLDAYAARFPADVEFYQPLRELGAAGSSLIFRSDFPDHLTSSAILLREGQIHLIHHSFLNIWIQPGGHIEPDDGSLLGAAMRELQEELDLAATSIAAHPFWPQDLPFDIARFDIPANPAKSEPSHVHWDLRFLFITNQADVSAKLSEVSGSAWFDISEAPDRLAAKLATLIGDEQLPR